MSLFKKKKETPEKVFKYENWEADFGFLTLILTRKKNITKQYLINIFSSQKTSSTDYLHDEEIEPIVENIVSEVYSQIGENYKNFLIEKYFGTEGNLVSFISEDVYTDLVADAINRNFGKLKKNLEKKAFENIQKLNTAKK